MLNHSDGVTDPCYIEDCRYSTVCVTSRAARDNGSSHSVLVYGYILQSRYGILRIFSGNYWIVNQILAKNLHNANDENMMYTVHLMDQLEKVCKISHIFCA